MTVVSLVEVANNLSTSKLYSFKVHLSSVEEYGAMLGHIHYNQSCFRFHSVSAPATILSENYAQDAARLTRVIEGDQGWIDDDGDDDGVATAEPGELRFIALSDKSSVDVFTFTFELVGVPTAQHAFTLDRLDFCNWDEEWVDTTIENLTVDLSSLDLITVKGTAIKSSNPQDELAFGAQLADDELSSIAEVGFVVIPSFCLGSNTLVIGQSYKGEQPLIVSISYDDYQASLTQDRDYLQSMIASDLGSHSKLNYTARAFIKFTDGTIAYSQNTQVAKNISDGQVTRSHAAVASILS